MKRLSVLGLFLAGIAAALLLQPAQAQSGQVQIVLLDRQGDQIERLIDGNVVQLQLEAPEDLPGGASVVFLLEGEDAPAGACVIPPGGRRCSTGMLDSLGWYWSSDGRPAPLRTVRATLDTLLQPGALQVTVAPRPVVMVHGFLSYWQTWQTYLGPDGHLAGIGLEGFAVGDGRAAGTLNTGSISDPAGRTNTIAENAAILDEYIAGVQAATGAEKVDLLVHSMGGMIARYYLAHIMQERNVAQLIILGTPNAGSACAGMVAALGFYLPASLEILPSYMTGVFNPQVSERRGVPFHALAGTLLVNPVSSPCTAVPSDSVVSVDSLTAIPMAVTTVERLHSDMTVDPLIFSEFVRPRLQTPPGAGWAAVEPPLAGAADLPLQFSQVYSGHIAAGEAAQVIIPIDAGVRVANFALYDDSQSLEIEVQGASGKTIALDPIKNGLLVVDDPQSLLTLGYGFESPKAGQWVVTLKTTAGTPAQGASYALIAKFLGGARLDASASSTLPALGEPVLLTVRLTGEDGALPIQAAEAVIRLPDGSQERLPLTGSGDAFTASFTPPGPGLYGVELNVQAAAAGLTVDRGAFLTFQVQAPALGEAQFWVRAAAIGAACLGAAVLLLGAVIAIRRRRRAAVQAG